MSSMILRGGIIIVFFLITLQAGGNQEPVELPHVGKTLSADKVEIVYTSQGSGKTAVIFIHGGFADRSFWTNQVKPFAIKYHVITLDLAGHGESGQNREKWDIFGFARDVRAVMEKEKIRLAVLVGNSMGGPVALETARLVPDKVLGIVAVDTFQVFMNAPPDYFQQQARAFRSDFNGTMQKMARALFHKDVDPGLYAQVEKKMLKGSTRMAASLMEFFATYDYVEVAKIVPHPIRCINGDLMPTQVEKNREIHPDFNAVTLPHSGHYPMLEKPELFNRHLEEILSEFSTSYMEEKMHPEYDTVKKTIEGSIGWAIKKDFDYLFSIFANDENFFQLWLTSDSKVVGIEAFKKFSQRWRTPDFRGTRFEFRDLRINFSRLGDVAWYSTYVDDCGEFKGKEYCIKDVFQTGVLEKRDGKWVHVQIHGSYPVDRIPEAYIKRYYKNLLGKTKEK